MKRNSTTIFLESPGATTSLPWVENAPDFTGFAEPTLSVLQNSWQAFLDSGEELEVISDPEPPSPAPDWEKFIQQFTLPGNPLYHATASKVQISGELVIEHWTNIRLGLLSPSIRNEEWLQLTYDYLKFILNQAGNPLSTEEQQAWTQLASECNIALV